MLAASKAAGAAAAGAAAAGVEVSSAGGHPHGGVTVVGFSDLPSGPPAATRGSALAAAARSFAAGQGDGAAPAAAAAAPAARAAAARKPAAAASRNSSDKGDSSPGDAPPPVPTPRPIPADHTLEVADRAVMRPLPGETVQAVVVRLLTAEVMHDVARASGAIARAARGDDGRGGEAAGGDESSGGGGKAAAAAAGVAAAALDTGGGGAHASESVMRTRFHLTPAFLRIAAARLGMCSSKREVLAAAARLRLCATIDAALLELFAAMEAEAPLAIEALCLLRVSAVGLQVSAAGRGDAPAAARVASYPRAPPTQEPEIVDMLGGSPAPVPQSEHRRPPLLHDLALQSAIQVRECARVGRINATRSPSPPPPPLMQVQVGSLSTSSGDAAQIAASKLYRHALVAAMNNLTAAQHTQSLSSAKRLAPPGYGSADNAAEDASTPAAAPAPTRGYKVPIPPPASLLPPVVAQAPRSSVPFDPRSWSAARRVLLASCVVRARGLWGIDSAAVAAAVDRWLLPTHAQRTLYLQARRAAIPRAPTPHLVLHVPPTPLFCSTSPRTSGLRRRGCASQRSSSPRSRASWTPRARSTRRSPSCVGGEGRRSLSTAPLEPHHPAPPFPLADAPGQLHCGPRPRRLRDRPLRPRPGGHAHAHGGGGGRRGRVGVQGRSPRRGHARRAGRVGRDGRRRGVRGRGGGRRLGRRRPEQRRSGLTMGGEDCPAMTTTSDNASPPLPARPQRAVITAALATGQPEVLRAVGIAHAHTLAERHPSYMLLSGYPVRAARPLPPPALAGAPPLRRPQAHAVMPVHEASLTASLLTATTDLRFVMWTAAAGGRRGRMALVKGLLNTYRSAVAVTTVCPATVVPRPPLLVTPFPPPIVQPGPPRVLRGLQRHLRLQPRAAVPPPPRLLRRPLCAPRGDGGARRRGRRRGGPVARHPWRCARGALARARQPRRL